MMVRNGTSAKLRMKSYGRFRRDAAGGRKEGLGCGEVGGRAKPIIPNCSPGTVDKKINETKNQ